MILRHFYHRGLLLPSSSCYYTASVKLANEFGWIAVSVSYPDGLDEIDSDRADARGLTASGAGMIFLHCGRQLSAHPLESLPSSPIPPHHGSGRYHGRAVSSLISIAAQLGRLMVEAVVEKMRPVKAHARPPEGTSGGRRCMAGQPPHRVLRLCLGNTGIRATHQEMHPTLDTVLHHGMVCISSGLDPSDPSSQPESRESARGRGRQGVDRTGDGKVRIDSPPSAVQNTQSIT